LIKARWTKPLRGSQSHEQIWRYSHLDFSPALSIDLIV
jgi:hypothetical protein